MAKNKNMARTKGKANRYQAEAAAELAVNDARNAEQNAGKNK